MSSGLSINTLRGLACLLLVGYHVIGDDSEAGLRLEPEHLASQANQCLSLIRMPLFSFLSGMVYALRPATGPLTPFAVGKTRRLLAPMLIVGTAFALLQTVTSGTNGGDYDWATLHIVPVAHYWFLEALFLIFLATALLERGGWLATPRAFLAVGVAAALLHVWAPLPMYLGLAGATFLWPFFLMGVAARRFPAPMSSNWMLGVITILPVGILSAWAATAMPPADAPGADRLLVGLCACLLLSRLRLESRGLAWIGAWSFGIYLFHPVFTAAARMGLKAAGLDDVTTLFVAGMAAGLSGSIALTASLRRLPLGHWALGERARTSRTASGRAGDPARSGPA
ncbi:hypothetical protein CDN99_20200 [Roseateles aquatilis]|uniref:Acyltransferase 3 domain-containing protein n=1 Tax=Roseateles aquatilis TaxID=431061 RepID=A0A246J0S7_9BURK|nr:acyltransferase [Roseateles aquatilis]OWQ86163.1 hypothetical protein CDN99_20200 [Roseateles aquatilis]